MSNVYEICFYGGLILAIIFLILSIVLFIVLKIPKVISELSGRAAKKEINKKRQGQIAEGSVSKKKEQAKYYNQNSGKITVRDTVSQETRATNRDDTTDNLAKEKTQEKKPVFTPNFDPEETAVLGATAELDDQIAEASGDASEQPTDVLRGDASDEATDVLRTEDADDEATDVLRTEDTDDEATDVLKTDDAGDDATDVLKTDDAGDDATDVLKTDDAGDEATDVLKTDDAGDDATDVLKTDDAGDDATDVLKTDDAGDDATDVLRSDEDSDEPATDVLRGDTPEDGDATTVLASKKTRQLAHKAKVIYNFVVVNTDEKI